MDIEQIEPCLLSVLPAETISAHPHDLEDSQGWNAGHDPGAGPSHVVRPRNVEELQTLVRAANRSGLNLTVASSTGTHCKGGTGGFRSSVRIDLSPWKAVEWINRRNRVCMIQPGVTYGDLLAALDPHGMTVPMPLAPRSGKSVVAAVMDREPSTWPNRQWDSSDPVASTEFLFGNGELFRTGAAGGPGTLEQQRAAGGAQKSPLGPSQTDFHRVIQGAQGTLGIVTWITLRTERKPRIEKPFLVGADHLEELIPFVYEVQRPWLGEHAFLLDRTAAALLMCGVRGTPFASLRGSLPPWVCLQNIAGFDEFPKDRVNYQEKDIREIAGRHGLSLSRALGRISARDLLATATRPCGETDWRHARKGHCLCVFFLTTLDRVPVFEEVFRVAARGFDLDETSVGTYVQPVVQNHACHVEFLVPFDPRDAGENHRILELEREAVKRLADSRAFFSRPYGSAQEIAFSQNPMNLEILKKVKQIFDPCRVLNRDKWGL
jgi:FAD/FMN-containing dehydrogenase